MDNAVELAKALDDPVETAQLVFGVDLWKKQTDILKAVQTQKRVAVKACHASSKSFTAAQAVLWWFLRYDRSTVITTAPSWVQVTNILWKEIKNLSKRSRIRMPEVKTVSLSMDSGNFAMGLSTNESDRFQGFHNDHVLLVLDEAAGIKGDIWEAVFANAAGGDTTILAIGNPTINSGPFYDAFTSEAYLWDCHTIDAFDTPNFEGITPEELLSLDGGDDKLDVTVRPYMIRRRWAWELGTSRGVDSARWRSRVRGQFPKQAEGSLLDLDDIAACAGLGRDPEFRVQVGIDVAGPGDDDTVVIIRCKNVVLFAKAIPDADPRGKVVNILREWKNRIENVRVDVIGIGWGLYCHLLDLSYDAIAVNVAESAIDADRFANKKAECYWALREMIVSRELLGLEPMVDGQKTKLITSQLASIRYKHDSRGRVLIESKEEARKRGVKSPDWAEALMLAYAPIGVSVEDLTAWARLMAGTNAKVEKIEESRDTPVPSSFEGRLMIENADVDESAIETYKEIYDDMTSSREMCVVCGKEIGTKKITDGVDSWHVTCRR